MTTEMTYTGMVIKSTGSWYTVKHPEKGIVPCKIRGQYRLKGSKATNPVAVGDKVVFNLHGDTGVIIDISERANYMIRKSSNLSKQYHIIAANLDMAYLMVTLVEPEVKIEFIDRFLVTAEAYQVPASLIFNKCDLYHDDEELDQLLKGMKYLYSTIGYPCFEVSATNRTGIDELKTAMDKKLNLVSGHSGVGKSTLINQLIPGLDIKTANISGYHRSGQHTTTFAEMYELPGSGYIIDTPGIKGFGLVDIQKEELYHFFPEIFKLSHQCPYNNCSHTHEPKCAVKKAVEEHRVSESRYTSYFNMYHEENSKYRKDIYDL